jgi:uncharacterized protein YuzE
MTFTYDQKSDMLYIELIDKPSFESEEVAPGVVLDFDENNQIVGIEIEDAKRRIDMSRLEVSSLPIADLIVSQREPAPAVSDQKSGYKSKKTET